MSLISAAGEAAHVTTGEWLVSLTAVLLAAVSVAVFWVTWRLTQVTSQVASIEMRKVATNANDDMRDVAVAHIHNDEASQ